MEFEAEARRVAEALFGAKPGDCQPAHYDLTSGPLSELDGILRLRDVTHLLMVTTSTRLEKTKGDVKKLLAARAAEEKNAFATIMWFITERQLDAQHVSFATKNGVLAVTLEQFRRRFFDGRAYIAARKTWAFGSARNLRDDSVAIPDGEYVPLPMHAEPQVASGSVPKGVAQKSVDIAWIAERVALGDIVVLTAPFGAGKSLTTHEVFLRVSQRYLGNTSAMVPVALNLRDHWGQDDYDEILNRHGRRVGYDKGSELVAAWRAGMVSLLVDGFDEVGSQAVASTDNKKFLSEARYRALKGVRDLISSRPKGSGILVCGRDHYFDGKSDLERSLGISGSKVYWNVQIGEFSDEGIQQFLKKAGTTLSVPPWLPRKPLLLAYLVHHRLLQEVLEIDSDAGFGFIWDQFIQRICDREATLEGAAMDSATVRSVLEFLAFKVRAGASGLGPISGLDLADAYERVSGQAPGDGVLPHLQRLPALSAVAQDPGHRSFVDEDMLYALQGGALARLVSGSDVGLGLRPLSSMPGNALKMAAWLAVAGGLGSETITAVAKRIESNKGRSDASGEYSHPQIVADCFELAVEIACQMEANILDLHGLKVEDALIGVIRADEIVIKDVLIQHCDIHELRLAASDEVTFKVRSCTILKLSGAMSLPGVPAELLDESCVVAVFDSMSTNAEVLKSDLSPSMKALVTVLRKLYKQAGGGRKKAALFRGISDQAVLSKIDGVVHILESSGLLRMFNQIAHPVRSESGRVDRILAGPMVSQDQVCSEARKL